MHVFSIMIVLHHVHGGHDSSVCPEHRAPLDCVIFTCKVYSRPTKVSYTRHVIGEPHNVGGSTCSLPRAYIRK